MNFIFWKKQVRRWAIGRFGQLLVMANKNWKAPGDPLNDKLNETKIFVVNTDEPKARLYFDMSK